MGAHQLALIPVVLMLICAEHWQYQGASIFLVVPRAFCDGGQGWRDASLTCVRHTGACPPYMRPLLS